MRVAFFGNVANSHYRAAKALRGYSDIDAHVFVDQREAATNHPDHDDPALAGERPPWIHVGRYLTSRTLVDPRHAPITAELRGFDAVVASGYGPPFAAFSGRPWAMLVTGADLTVRPFPLRLNHFHRRFDRRIAALWTGAWQRYALRRANALWSQPFAPFVSAADRLGVSDRVSDAYLPMAIDADRFRRNPGARSSPVVRDAVQGSDFVVFHPSRLVLDGSDDVWATGQVKRNDVLVRGFARFVQRGACASPRLLLTDWSQSRDTLAVRDLVRDLGIESNVTWLRGRGSAGLSQGEMIDLYSAADVVCDDFGAGWFGFVVLEALAIGTPVVTHIDPTAMSRLYPWHPARLAADEAAVDVAFTELAIDRDAARATGEDGRRWILEFHAAAPIAAAYASALRELAASG